MARRYEFGYLEQLLTELHMEDIIGYENVKKITPSDWEFVCKSAIQRQSRQYHNLKVFSRRVRSNYSRIQGQSADMPKDGGSVESSCPEVRLQVEQVFGSHRREHVATKKPPRAGSWYYNYKTQQYCTHGICRCRVQISIISIISIT